MVTLLLDAAKGAAAVWLAQFLYFHFLAGPQGDAALTALQMHQKVSAIGAEAALFAVIGHVFPVWLKFAGGKGVPTGLGSFIMLAPKAVLLLVMVFAVMALVFRYVSLASVTVVTIFPMLAAFLDGYSNAPRTLGLMIIASAIIIVKHRDNLRRLSAGTESRLQVRSQ